MPHTILHVDFNNFYASVETKLHPELKGKPVAVCGSSETRHGIVLAKSPEAKAFGVSTGEAVWQAKQKCPGLIVVPPTFEEYLKFSHLGRNIYSRYTDQVEPFGMDECWLDVGGSERLFGDGKTIAEEIREKVKEELGITVSVGVSFNKIFAKLGSDMKKPDAVTSIPQSTFRDIVWELPAGEMLGVGRSTGKALAMHGIYTIGDLARAKPESLSYYLGKNGRLLSEYANGRDNSPVMPIDFESPVKSIGHGITTMRDMVDEGDVFAIMLWLCRDIGHRLRIHGKAAGGVAVDLRDNDLHFSQMQSKLKFPTRSATEIAKQALAIFRHGWKWDKPLRALTVRAIDLLCDENPYQTDIFSDMCLSQRIETLDDTVDDLRGRFGNDIIKNASLLKEDLTDPVKEAAIIMPTGMCR